MRLHVLHDCLPCIFPAMEVNHPWNSPAGKWKYLVVVVVILRLLFLLSVFVLPSPGPFPFSSPVGYIMGCDSVATFSLEVYKINAACQQVVIFTSSSHVGAFHSLKVRNVRRGREVSIPMNLGEWDSRDESGRDPPQRSHWMIGALLPSFLHRVPPVSLLPPFL